MQCVVCNLMDYQEENKQLKTLIGRLRHYKTARYQQCEMKISRGTVEMKSQKKERKRVRDDRFLVYQFTRT